MKFLSIINRNYLFTISFLFVTTSIVTFFILKKELTENTKEDLLERAKAVSNEIESRNNLPNYYPSVETEIISKVQDVEKSFKEVLVKDMFDDGEEEPFLEYKSIVSINGNHYAITVRKSLIEYEELLLAISIPLLLLLVLTFILSFVITRKLNKKVWKDFELNLSELRQFSFRNSEEIKLKKTNIQEFDILNNSIIELTNKLLTDYRILKEFSENASHEIQTPIAIISVNLEEMLQHNIPEQTFQMIVNTQQTLKRLSDLNKNLLLLAKIENREFSSDQEIDLNKYIKSKIDELSPLIKSKGLKVEIITHGAFKVRMSPELVDILLNNLLMNAVKHNSINGKIYIEIKESELKIYNTGASNKLTNQTIFNRFTKENSQSFGLGLSIVKQICSTHNITIHYQKSDLHYFVLSKNLEL
jgi:signal transduction histidine kinase